MVNDIFVMVVIFLFVITLLRVSQASNQWPNHDISTLKLLQIVHRHGDRSPMEFKPNDPYKSDHYWPQGIGQLTTEKFV